MLRLPGLPALRVFEAAARHLSFTRAALELGVTPAAVSNQIRLLEDQLGRRLFPRTSRTMQLTPQGETLLGGVTAGLRHPRPLGAADHDGAAAAPRRS